MRFIGFCFAVLFILSGFLWAQEVIITIASGDQVAPYIVAGDSCFLVVWEDHRAGDSNINIFAQTVFFDATTGSGFPICTAPASNQNYPVATYYNAPDTFITIWHDERDAATALYARNSLCSGVSDSLAEWLVLDAVGNLSAPEVAFSGTHYLYTWMLRVGSDFETKYLILDSSGMPSGSIMELSGAGSKGPATAFNGFEFLVVWEDSAAEGQGIFAKYFDSSGTPIGDAFMLVDDINASAPALCGVPADSAGNSKFAIAWQNLIAGTNTDINAAIIEHSTPTPITGVCLCSDTMAQSTPAIGYHEHGFITAWEDKRPIYQTDIYGRYLALTGVPSGDEFIICDAVMGQQAPRLAYSSSAEKYLCIWIDQRDVANSDIYGALLEPPPATEGPVVTSVTPTEGTISGCDSTMTISLSSGLPIDDATILIALDDDSFDISDAEVSLAGLTIYFHPSYPAAVVETMEVCLVDVADNDGIHITEPYFWSWIWDDAAPQINSTTPTEGAALDEFPELITAAISDDGAGVDGDAIAVTINSVLFEMPYTGMYWDGYTLTLNLEELGFSILPETNIVIFYIDDEAFCPNSMSDTLTFYVLANPGPMASAQLPLHDEITSCEDQQIQISITDADGIDEATISLSVNDIVYDYPDHITFISSLLSFTPSPVFGEGLVNVILISADDSAGNPLSTPLTYDFTVDLTPPSFISATYTDGTEIDTLDDDNFAVSADDVYCDSLNLNFCYVRLSHTGSGAVFARWDVDSLVRTDDFNFHVPSAWFHGALATGAETTPDTFIICIRLADSPNHCSPNMLDSCWTVIYHGRDTEGPIALPDAPMPDEVTSCTDQQIRIYINDTDGVDEISIRLAVDGVDYSYPDHMSYIPPTLVFTPSEAFDEGTVAVSLNDAMDMLENHISDTLSYEFTVDITPPTLISCTYPAYAELDSTANEDFIIESEDNYCDSLKLHYCHVILSRLGDGLVARWDSTSLVSIDEFSFMVTADSFLTAIGAASLHDADTFDICTRIVDATDYCLSNTLDTCWTIISRGAEIHEVKPPENIALSISPNPFNSILLIKYSATGTGKIKIFDPTGHLLYRYSFKDSGAFTWDGCDEEGMPLPSGTYFIRLDTDDGSVTRPVQFVR